MTTPMVDIGVPRGGRPKIGLKDGGHVLLSCSNCRKPLMDIHITQPNKLRLDGTPFVWRVRAKCCYCGDYSYIKEIRGLFHPAGHGIPNPANPDDLDDNLVVTSLSTPIEEKDSRGNVVCTFPVKEFKRG